MKNNTNHNIRYTIYLKVSVSTKEMAICGIGEYLGMGIGISGNFDIAAALLQSSPQTFVAPFHKVKRFNMLHRQIFLVLLF